MIIVEHFKGGKYRVHGTHDGFVYYSKAELTQEDFISGELPEKSCFKRTIKQFVSPHENSKFEDSARFVFVDNSEYVAISDILADFEDVTDYDKDTSSKQVESLLRLLEEKIEPLDIKELWGCDTYTVRRLHDVIAGYKRHTCVKLDDERFDFEYEPEEIKTMNDAIDTLFDMTQEYLSLSVTLERQQELFVRIFYVWLHVGQSFWY